MDWTENQNLKALVRKLENAACDCNMMSGHSCGFHKIANELRDEIAKEVKGKNEDNSDMETCANCGKTEEGDIFGGLIDGKYWCPSCCEPLKAKWYAEEIASRTK